MLPEKPQIFFLVLKFVCESVGKEYTKIANFGILPKYNGNIVELKTHYLANKHFQDHNLLYQPVLKLLMQKVKTINLTLEATQQ